MMVQGRAMKLFEKPKATMHPVSLILVPQAPGSSRKIGGRVLINQFFTGEALVSKNFAKKLEYTPQEIPEGQDCTFQTCAGMLNNKHQIVVKDITPRGVEECVVMGWAD